MKLSFLILAFLLLTFGFIPQVIGQPLLGIPFQEQPEAPGVIEAQNIEEIQNKLQRKIIEIEGLKEVDETLKEKVLDLYRQALSHLEAAKTSKRSAEEYKQSIETAPAEVKRIRKALEELLAQPSSEASIEIPSEATPQDLEGLLAKEQAEQTAMKSKFSELEAKIKNQQDRPSKARQQLSEAKQKIEEIEKELKSPPSADENPMLTEARNQFLDAQKVALKSETTMLEQELVSNEARLGLLLALRDKTERLVFQAEAVIQKLEKKIPERRTAEAKKERDEAEKARREAIDKDPIVSKLANQNLEWSDLRLKLEKEIKEVSSKRLKISEDLNLVEKEFKNAKQKAEIAGLSRVLGEVLREQGKKLPNTRQYQREAAERKEIILSARLKRMEIEEMQKNVSVPEKAVKNYMNAVDKEASLEKCSEIEKAITEGVLAKREILDNLVSTYQKYIIELGELDGEQQQLINKTKEYITFLNQRLLWIPSTIPVGKTTLQNLKDSLFWICDPKAWMEVGKEVLADLASIPVLKIISLFAFAVLILLRSRFYRKLEKISEKVGKVHRDSFFLTIQALVITFLLAAPWPILIGCIARLAGDSFDASKFTRTVSAGLKQTAILLFALQFTRLICLAKGVGKIHFKWSGQSLELLRRNLAWITIIVLPAQFILAATEWQSDVKFQESIGRLAFLVAMIAMALFIRRVFNPNKGVFTPLLVSNPKGWLSRLRYVWFWAILFIPMAFIFLTIAGYYYTALQLGDRYFTTFVLCVSAAVIYGILRRWLYVARRRLAFAKAREKREAAIAKGKDESKIEAGDKSSPVVHEIPELDLETISQQTRHLLQALIGIFLIISLWLLWEDVLPALKVFEEVALWHYNVVVEGAEKLYPVTLADLALAILTGILTTVAARDLPGVMEIVLLQRLPLDAGSRYAITTISRYLIIAVGLIVGFGFIGISWSSVQWLVAALGIGLGFGLQEIFANFISGLIILFERPIRLGDTVTVGDVNGTVSRIQIRATTITDWDRKELIVPNKTFITGQLINWSLSDQITRLIIDVGIAYGSDTDLAYKVMLETVKGHPLVLDDPPPGVYFLGFSDSSLSFSVRFYVKELSHRFQTYHDLHMAIDKALRKHNIEIAFPQRDIHLRSVKAPIMMGKMVSAGNLDKK